MWSKTLLRTRVEQAPVVAANASENRIGSAAPTALANGYIVPEGYILDPADTEPEMGDRVIKPGSPDVGVMAWIEELDEDDFNHPQNAEWVAGDIARNDIEPYLGYAVQFDHGTDIIEVGQRGFHREHGVPRTTVQEWLKAINA